MNDAQQPLNALPQGHRLQEYELVRVLGFGGFGMTYLGFDHNLDKAVAIKEYLPSDIAIRTGDNSVVPQASQFRDDFEWGLDRFLDEARALARFDHRHIIKVHRFFEAHGTAYIVMEYAEGETLSAFLERKETLKEAELKAILSPILDGLEVVHGVDFLHRDIKPGNIIIRDEDNSPVLLDFGSARQAISARSRSVTSIITPGYAPIEQYSSRGDQGPWTDIYALGGVCYRALTGEVPEDATDRVRNDPLIPVSERCVGQARAEFLSAIDWALAVDEGDRPQGIAEWRTKLEDVQKMLWSAGLADAARQLGVSAGELDFIRKKYSLRLPKLVARKKTKGKLRAAVICVVTLSIIGILGKIYTYQDQKTDWQVFVIMEGHEPSPIGTNDRGETDLHIAAAWNLSVLIISLLNQGADINAQDNDGRTPLHTAVSTIFGGREREAIEVLLNQGADANVRNNDGDAPLHTVCLLNFYEMAEVLLKHGANVNVKDNDSNTPLHRAVRSNALETAEVLLKHGAHLNAETNDGRTPLHVAAMRNAREIAGVLLKHGANVNVNVNMKNKLYGWTPLHFAAIHNAHETAEVLLNQGADVNAKDGSGNTPLSMTKPFKRSRNSSRIASLR